MGVVSRRWMWVESMGVVSRCGCKEVYRFPHITYSYSSCIYLFFFAAASLLFVHLKNVFCSFLRSSKNLTTTANTSLSLVVPSKNNRDKLALHLFTDSFAFLV